MTNKELTSLALKIFTIYVFVQTIMMFAQAGPIYMTIFNYSNEKLWTSIPILASALLLIICVILWRLANDIIEKVKTPKQRGDDYRVDQVFILHLIGFYMISQALINNIGYSISLYYMSRPDQFGLTQSYAESSKLIIFFNYFTGFVQLIIGLTLVFKPYGWARFFQKIRGRE